MFAEEKIALDCPCCKAVIYRPLPWFRKTYSACPACGSGLAASQFAAALEAIEGAFDDHIEEQIQGTRSVACCGSSSCGAGS